MPDREFDNYLALLASLLRLSAHQRDAIAEELRSHLEDRLEEFTQGGVSHDEAVRQALAEFGDAAGLAGQFIAISHARRRRWLMRMTTFSLCTMVLFAAGLALLWPGGNAGPGRAAITAQEEKTAEEKTPPENKTSPGKEAEKAQSPAEPPLEEKLNKRMNIDIVEMPLKDVIQYLQNETGIQFVLRMKKLEEAGVSADVPVTKSLKHVRISTLLDLLLGDLELTYVDKDDLLLITTPEDAESTLQIRVYDCRDLIAMAGKDVGKTSTAPPAPAAIATLERLPSGQIRPVPVPAAAPTFPAAESATGGTVESAKKPAAAGRNQRPAARLDPHAEDLMELVISIVDPDSWSDVGGPGAIDVYDGLVVVAQTAATHKKVERLFNMLREAAGLEAHNAARVVR